MEGTNKEDVQPVLVTFPFQGEANMSFEMGIYSSSQWGKYLDPHDWGFGPAPATPVFLGFYPMERGLSRSIPAPVCGSDSPRDQPRCEGTHMSCRGFVRPGTSG